jgi:hypothetical protein
LNPDIELRPPLSNVEEKTTGYASEVREKKLSEALLLPELEENESLFERDKDTGKERIL